MDRNLSKGISTAEETRQLWFDKDPDSYSNVIVLYQF